MDHGSFLWVGELSWTVRTVDGCVCRGRVKIHISSSIDWQNRAISGQNAAQEQFWVDERRRCQTATMINCLFSVQLLFHGNPRVHQAVLWYNNTSLPCLNGQTIVVFCNTLLSHSVVMWLLSSGPELVHVRTTECTCVCVCVWALCVFVCSYVSRRNIIVCNMHTHVIDSVRMSHHAYALLISQSLTYSWTSGRA